MCHVRVVFGRRQAGGEWVMGQYGKGVGHGERRGAKFEGHTNEVTSVSFSGDGKQVVSGSRTTQ